MRENEDSSWGRGSDNWEEEADWRKWTEAKPREFSDQLDGFGGSVLFVSEMRGKLEGAFSNTLFYYCATN